MEPNTIFKLTSPRTNASKEEMTNKITSCFVIPRTKVHRELPITAKQRPTKATITSTYTIREIYKLHVMRPSGLNSQPNTKGLTVIARAMMPNPASCMMVN